MKASVKKKSAPRKSAPAKAPVRAKTKTAGKKAVRAKAPVAETIPAILLEGDESPAPAASRSGPGSRYALGAAAEAPHRIPDEEPGELPEAYGTGRLLVFSRDPQWLYAHWDLTAAQLREHNRQSRDGHLIVRVFDTVAGAQAVSETHVHPESRNWFIHVGKGGRKYAAELGYYDRKGRWQSVAESGTVITPAEDMSDEAFAEFATLPAGISLPQVVELIKAATHESRPLVQALQELRAQGYAGLPAAHKLTAALRATGPAARPAWSAAQERALAEIITMDEVRRVWVGSFEVTELVRKQLVKELASQAAARVAEELSGAVGGARAISSAGMASPHGGAGPGGRRGFWFNVNAELIIYGATEPDATVTIGERRIRLRSDGTFSYRFALPDGRYDLPVEATSASGDDSRSAALFFSRQTEYLGDVARHPQDAALKPPRVENVA